MGGSFDISLELYLLKWHRLYGKRVILLYGPVILSNGDYKMYYLGVYSFFHVAYKGVFH